jgi:hypothetical protein
MSNAAFQAMLVRLVMDPEFRDSVARQGADGLPDSLTARERTRLAGVATDPGMTVTRTLYKGFRLGKLLTLLPLSCRALGDDRLARQVAAFWESRPSMSFYYLEEAAAFCDFLSAHLGAEADGAALGDVVAFERAGLELQRARPPGESPPTQFVRLRHHPDALLAAVAAGSALETLAPSPCVLVGGRDATGAIQWVIADRIAIQEN